MTDLLVLRVGAGGIYKSDSHADVLILMDMEEEASREHKGKERSDSAGGFLQATGEEEGGAWHVGPMSKTRQQDNCTTPSFRDLGDTKHACAHMLLFCK